MQPQPQPKCIRCFRTAHTAGGGYCTFHAYALGHLQPFVDRDTAMKAVKEQLGRGHTLWSLQKAAGLHPTTLYKFWEGDAASWGSSGLKRTTYDAIVNAPRWTDNALVPAWPSTRRIQALRAAGHSLRKLTDYLGVNQSVLVAVSAGKNKNVRYHVDQKIREMFEELQMEPARRPEDPKIVAKRWPLPLEWIDIDDPEERRGLLTTAERNDRVPQTPEVIDASRYLLEVFGTGHAASHHSGVTQQVLSGVSRGVRPVLCREIVHRIEYAAQRVGWGQSGDVAA